MANAGVMRELEDGGFSICYASEENVGKKKCKHKNGGKEIPVTQERGFKIVDCTEMIDSDETTQKERKSKVISYFTSLQSSLSPKQKQEILAVLR